MLMRKKLESFQDAEYNFHLIDRLLRGQGLDGDHIREIPALKVTGSLQAHQVVVGSDTMFEEGYDPQTVLLETRNYIMENLAGLGNLAWEDAVEKALLGATIIQGGYLVTGMIDAARIDTGTLHADRISARSISTDKITIGGVTHTNLGNNAVQGNNIAANTIVAAHILAGEITTAKLQAGAVTTDKISANAVEISNLGTTVIDGGYIKTELLTADHIRTGTLSGVFINVLEDIYIGERMIIRSSSVTSGIEFHMWGGNNKSAEIFVDPGGAFVLHNPTGEGVWAADQRLDLPGTYTATFG